MLRALGVDDELAHSSIRFGASWAQQHCASHTEPHRATPPVVQKGLSNRLAWLRAAPIAGGASQLGCEAASDLDTMLTPHPLLLLVLLVLLVRMSPSNCVPFPLAFVRSRDLPLHHRGGGRLGCRGNSQARPAVRRTNPQSSSSSPCSSSSSSSTSSPSPLRHRPRQPLPIQKATPAPSDNPPPLAAAASAARTHAARTARPPCTPRTQPPGMVSSPLFSLSSHSCPSSCRLREMSPLYDMFLDGIDLKSVQWSQH